MACRSNMTKEEALKQIDELKKFVENCDKKVYIPEVGETVICHGLQSNPFDYGNVDGDIAIVTEVCREDGNASLYNPRWDDGGEWRAYFTQIEPLDIDEI